MSGKSEEFDNDDHPPTRGGIRATFQEMIHEGILIHNGEYRLDRNGAPQPVYVLASLKAKTH